MMSRLAPPGPARWLLALAVLLLQLPAQAQAQKRIITIGGDITETVFALGAGSQVVATDSSSAYPEGVKDLAKVGYLRSLSAEGLLSLEPDLIIISGAAGPQSTLDLLAQSGVDILAFPSEYHPAIIAQKIRRIGARLQREQAAQALLQQLDTDLQALRQARQAMGDDRAVLFFATLRDGAPRAAGRETAADGLIALLGGNNVFAQRSGYHSLSLEAAVQANPDWIWVLRNYAMQDKGASAAAQHPALALSPAARAGRIFMVDVEPGLQFGPRTPRFALELLHSMLAMQTQPSS